MSDTSPYKHDNRCNRHSLQAPRWHARSDPVQFDSEQSNYSQLVERGEHVEEHI